MVSEYGLQPWHKFPRRLPFPSLPATECAGVDAQATRQHPLTPAHGTAIDNYPFAKRAGLSITGIVAHEGNDFGDEAELRGAAIGLPVVDSGLVHPQLLSHLSLKQAEIEPSLPEMVTEGAQLAGISGRRRLPAGQLKMAKGQRNPVGAATGTDRSLSALGAPLIKAIIHQLGERADVSPYP